MTSECPICFDTYQNEGPHRPKLLICSHTVCLSCLEQLARDGNSPVNCPECRAVCPLPQGGADAFPTNRYVLSNLQLAERIDQLETSQKQTDGIVSDILQYTQRDDDILRNVIVHSISGQTASNTGTSVGTAAARSNEIEENAINNQRSRERENATSTGNTAGLHCTGFCHYVRDNFVGCKQRFATSYGRCFKRFIDFWWIFLSPVAFIIAIIVTIVLLVD